jgi:hypothetical protein
MSYTGRWLGKRGKFVYAEPIPKNALDVIVRCLHGEPDMPMMPAPRRIASQQ